MQANAHNMNATQLHMPLAESDVRALRTGDLVHLNGVLFTGRDAVHKYLFGGGTVAADLTDAVLYHCGPVTVRRNDRWEVMAAGPTTSIREEPYMAELIARYRLRGVIGKGGMGEATLAACREHGCVYLHAVGGAAQVLARTIEEVEDVFLLERFGAPEAVWQLRVRGFPALVTMDAAGNSLHETVGAQSLSRLRQLGIPA
jgi:fumarate hydratase class I